VGPQLFLKAQQIELGVVETDVDLYSGRERKTIVRYQYVSNRPGRAV
jgi:hypothetical protein